MGLWLNNWRGLRNAWLICGFRAGFSTVKNMSGTVLSGDHYYSVQGPMGQYYNGTSVPYGPVNMVAFGTNGTAPDPADFTLTENSAIRILSLTADYSNTYDTESGVVSKVVKATVTNNGSQDVTVREWGVVDYAGSNSNRVLLYRDVLSPAVTLVPQQNAVLTLTLSVTLDDPI